MNESWDTHFGSNVFLTSSPNPWYDDLDEPEPNPAPIPVPIKQKRNVTEHFESKKEIMMTILLALIIILIIRYFI
jgi:hypothetical protein